VGYSAKVLDYLSSQEDELLGFTQSLIATPSPNPPGDERAVAELILDRLQALGLKGAEIAAKDPRRPNIIFRLPGGGGPGLALSGHLDTKPVGDQSRWRVDPYAARIIDGQLYGLGCGDMKAALAAMVYAAAALKKVRAPLAGDLWLVLTADEEAGSAYGVDYLVEQNLVQAGAVILGEPCGISREWEYLCLLSRGNCCFKIKTKGTQMHSSISDLLPSVNASLKMARVMTRMAEDLLPRLNYRPHPLCPQGPTLNIGVMVRGGVYYGVYPGEAEFACDLRTLPGMTQDQVREAVQGWLHELRQEDPELEVALEFEPPPLGWIEPSEIPAAHPLVPVLLRAATEVLDRAPALGSIPGTTDAPKFQSGLGLPTVPAFGPGLLPLAHGPNERISIKSPGQAARIYALAALYFLTRDDGSGGPP